MITGGPQIQHDSFSHIHSALVSSLLYSEIIDSTILPIIVSDHTPILLTLGGVPLTTLTKIWRFPSYLHDSDDFRAFQRTHLQTFVDHHVDHLDNNTFIWLTSKAIMRGHIISYLAMRQGKRNDHFHNLLYISVF